MNLQGKTVLITGASRGIGRAIALELAQQGVAKLILLARNEYRLEQVAAEIEALNPGVKVVPLVVDLTQSAVVSGLVSRAWRDHGPIDMLINNAGVAHQHNFVSARFQDIEQELNVNLLGMYNITRFMARRMKARKAGVIVNVSSLMGKLPAPSMATYSATKSAILGFTRALRAELASDNVRVVSLLPSLTETDMVHNIQKLALVSTSQPEEVARALVLGLRRGSREILVGWQSHVAVMVNRLSPYLAEQIVQWSFALSNASQQKLPDAPEIA